MALSHFEGWCGTTLSHDVEWKSSSTPRPVYFWILLSHGMPILRFPETFLIVMLCRLEMYSEFFSRTFWLFSEVHSPGLTLPNLTYFPYFIIFSNWVDKTIFKSWSRFFPLICNIHFEQRTTIQTNSFL